jgi:uncharacterized surface protein with fasciclin (FAS1) repeats
MIAWSETMIRRSLIAFSAAAMLAAPVFAGHHGKDIVATATAAGNFTTLVAAAQAAGLVETLQGPGPFTVFAPTDAAFAALPAGTVETLLLPENRDQLVSILAFHVVPGRVMAADLAAGCNPVATVQGANVTICAGDTVTVGGANVVTADVGAANVVIHVIDAVIMPPS